MKRELAGGSTVLNLAWSMGGNDLIDDWEGYLNIQRNDTLRRGGI